MNWFLRICLTGGVCLLALLPTAAPAQSDNSPKEPPGDTKVGEERLTMDSLKAILEGLAYDEFKELKDKNGKVEAYQAKRTEGTWTYYGKFELSPDQTQVWISMTLAKLPDAGTIPPKVLLDLLAVNDKIWPSYFMYSQDGNRFYMYSPIANRGLKAKDLRARSETMCSDLKANEALWNPAKWPTNKPVDNPPTNPPAKPGGN